ncbi:MAG: hypothetical protein EPO21_23795 [Chloroflexota bacterium]|nr:MAG: hypothetical protein EPO21_23795 [Chloroflexota bacterium]
MSAACSICFDELVDYIGGQMAPDRRSVVDAHLKEGCRSCLGHVTWLRLVTDSMESDDSREPPIWVTRRAIRLFRERGPRPRPTLLQRVAAALVFDNTWQPQLAGIRGSTLTSTRQMLFSADDIDVDVRVDGTDGQCEVMLVGQVLPNVDDGRDLSGVEIHLLQGRRELFHRVTDRLGEFTIGRLPHGKYRLLIRLSDREITIPGFEI